MKKARRLKIQTVTKVRTAGCPRAVSFLLLPVRLLGWVQRIKAKFTKHPQRGYYLTGAPAGTIVADGMMTVKQSAEFAAEAVTQALKARQKITDRHLLAAAEENVKLIKLIKVLQSHIHKASKN